MQQRQDKQEGRDQQLRRGAETAGRVKRYIPHRQLTRYTRLVPQLIPLVFEKVKVHLLHFNLALRMYFCLVFFSILLMDIQVNISFPQYFQEALLRIQEPHLSLHSLSPVVPPFHFNFLHLPD